MQTSKEIEDRTVTLLLAFLKMCHKDKTLWQKYPVWLDDIDNFYVFCKDYGLMSKRLPLKRFKTGFELIS